MFTPVNLCNSPLVLGIDPGAHGAIAFLTTSGELLQVHDMPSNTIKRSKRQVMVVSPYDLAQLLMPVALAGNVKRAFVEQVGAMPGQGVSSMFAFGRHVGMVEGVLAGLSISISYVLPQAWRRYSQVPEGKDGSRLRACQLWPAHAATFKRSKDDGRAEAALIGRYSLAAFPPAAAVAQGLPSTPPAPFSSRQTCAWCGNGIWPGTKHHPTSPNEPCLILAVRQ
jgi:crossover junction endodeoxyribonuclease RuvC